MNNRAHVTIFGDVIGVGFRSWAVTNAVELKLTGWVKNTPEKSVEAVFEGADEQVREMVDRCHNGPDVAWVEKVTFKFEEPTGEFEDFEIRK